LVSNLGPQSQRTRISEQFNISAEEMLAAVRQQCKGPVTAACSSKDIDREQVAVRTSRPRVTVFATKIDSIRSRLSESLGWEHGEGL
jgi:hypothetical protein